MQVRIKKFNTYSFLILTHTILSVSCQLVLGYKGVLLKSLPGSSGKLAEELLPIWNKVMLMDNINDYITLILSITGFTCLLCFMYILGAKDDSNIKRSLLLTVFYLVLSIVFGTIAHITDLTLYGNTLLWFRKSIGYIVLIIVIGIIRQTYFKLKERGIANE